MRRWVAGSAIAAALVAAGFVVARETGARAALGQLTVRGRVTGVDGRPVRGVKVWLVH
jgi:protocatechuate 3,4-dioxygenase beta subunit